MYELLQQRKVDEGNRRYTIVKAGTAAAYSKDSPDKIFTSNGKDSDYVDFAERRRKLIEEQKKEKEVELNWGQPEGR